MSADAVFGLGTMAFAGPTSDPAESLRILSRAIDDGVTFIDTADVYGRGSVEELIAPVVQARRSEIVLASKIGLPMSDDPADRGLAPERIRPAVTASLRRLGIDHLDLEQCHRPDPAIPLEETLGALAELVDEGLIAKIGSSCFRADAIRHAAATGQGFAYEQAPYSLFVRSRESDVFPACEELQIDVIAWSPLDGGWLTGKYGADRVPPPDSRAARAGTFVRSDDPVKMAAAASLGELAASVGVSLAHLALAWVLAQPAVSIVLLGPRTMAQYEELIGARVVRLLPSVLGSAMPRLVSQSLRGRLRYQPLRSRKARGLIGYTAGIWHRNRGPPRRSSSAWRHEIAFAISVAKPTRRRSSKRSTHLRRTVFGLRPSPQRHGERRSQKKNCADGVSMKQRSMRPWIVSGDPVR